MKDPWGDIVGGHFEQDSKDQKAIDMVRGRIEIWIFCVEVDQVHLDGPSLAMDRVFWSVQIVLEQVNLCC